MMPDGDEKNPTISVIMAGYQSKAEFISKALDSIKEQTYKNFELIFVDDGCEKEIISLIQTYSSFYKITVIKNEINLGLPRSLNRGLSVASGKYIARLDDDDIMLPERLEKQLSYMEKHPDYAGCWSEFIFIDNLDSEVKRSHISRVNFLKHFLEKGNCCCHSSLFIRKSIMTEIGGYDKSFLYAQDLELYLRILGKYKMGCVPEYLVKFRINTTRNPLKKQLLSFTFSYVAALKYAHDNKSCKIRLWIVVRTILFAKFGLIDMYKRG